MRTIIRIYEQISDMDGYGQQGRTLSVADMKACNSYGCCTLTQHASCR
jgi:hypothetical protein